MGKLEKFGRSLLKKLGGARNQNRRRATSSADSTSSDEDHHHVGSRSMPDVHQYVHKFQVVPPDEVSEPGPSPPNPRTQSPAVSEHDSAGYSTDNSVLSSLSPLDVKRVSVDYSESQGYYSTAELSPVPRITVEDEEQTTVILEPPGVYATVPRITRDPTAPFISTVPRQLDPTAPLRTTVPASDNYTVPRITVDPTVTPRTPLFVKKPSQEYPRINVAPRLNKIHPLHKSTHLLTEKNKENENMENVLEAPKFSISGRSATLSNLTDREVIEDPIERFLKSSIYKTKMITTVFEAKDGGIEEIYQDVHHEIDRWFETKNMMAVACEMHWSVPSSKRSRQLECKLKEKLLNALRENNKRLLYLKGMGKGKTPVKLAESKTVENISRDKETDSVRGIYQRSYTRLLPYLHKETPEWHSQYWTLQDLQEPEHQDEAPPTPQPQNFLFNDEPSDVLSKNSLISLNIIGLSILGNGRKSCGSLF